MNRPRSGAFSAALTSCSVVLLAAGVPQAGRAEALELRVAPLISRTPSGPCPPAITLIETLQPYREGSYGVDGRAALGTVATGWRLANRDAFSATWMGQLRAPYQRCTASAGIVRSDTMPFKEHSYLRMRFSGGQAQLILDRCL